MKKKSALWQAIKDNMESGIRVMLLYVLESNGSSPGRQGFGMMVAETGGLQGSIGGGIMEHKFVELAKQKLRDSGAGYPEVRKQLHNKSAAKNQSGMICSGEQTVLIYEVRASDAPAIDHIIYCLQNHSDDYLLLSPEGIQTARDEGKREYEYGYKTDEEWFYKEALGYRNHLYIIGAGHCALAFSKLMYAMDFYIYLFDDRRELHTMEQNDFVHQKRLVHQYSELTSLIPPGENNYVVVMTFGYRTDDVAVRALLNKDFKYFGLLGSSSKIEKMFAGYKAEGISEALLKKIQAPVGLPIKSESPEEIAVSIAAQIIKVKNEAGDQ